MLSLIAGAVLFAGQSLAASCPAFPDRTQERAQLLADLADADTFKKGEAANHNMWVFWRTAPDAAAQEMLNAGLGAIRVGDYIVAVDVLTDLVAYCPDYAEGYNQLAFAYFLRNENAKSEALLKQTLALEPSHFGALSGLGLIYLRTDRPALAQIYLRKGVAVNPWMNERSLLTVDPKGDDL